MIVLAFMSFCDESRVLSRPVGVTIKKDIEYKNTEELHNEVIGMASGYKGDWQWKWNGEPPNEAPMYAIGTCVGGEYRGYVATVSLFYNKEDVI